MAKALRPIYQAETAELAAERLEEFDAGEWVQNIPPSRMPGAANGIRSYRSSALRRLHSQVRKAVRSRGHSPSDKAASKLIYLVLQNIEAKWTRPPITWHQAKAQFAMHFEERFVVTG